MYCFVLRLCDPKHAARLQTTGQVSCISIITQKEMVGTPVWIIGQILQVNIQEIITFTSIISLDPPGR